VNNFLEIEANYNVLTGAQGVKMMPAYFKYRVNGVTGKVDPLISFVHKPGRCIHISTDPYIRINFNGQPTNPGALIKILEKENSHE